MKEVEWADLKALLDSKSDQKKKRLCTQLQEEQAEKNPYEVQRDLSLIRQKQFL